MPLLARLVRPRLQLARVQVEATQRASTGGQPLTREDARSFACNRAWAGPSFVRGQTKFYTAVGGSAMASLADTRAALMPSKSSPIIPVNLNLDLRQSTSHTRVIEIRPMGGKPPSRPMSASRHMEQVAPWVAEGIAPPSAADPTWHMAS